MGGSKFLIATALTLLGCAEQVSAADLTGQQSYLGKVISVAPGFFGQVGVVLEPGTTCNGQGMVLLMGTNPKYKEILALLMLAQTSGQQVHLARIASTSSNTGTPAYCAITEASLGAVPVW